MRTVTTILALALGAVPVQAQIWDGGGATGGQAGPPDTRAVVGRDLSDIDRSIRDGRRSGELTRREARAFEAQRSSIARAASHGFADDAAASQLLGMTLSLRGAVEARRNQPR